MALTGNVTPKGTVTGQLFLLGYNEVQALAKEMEERIQSADELVKQSKETAENAREIVEEAEEILYPPNLFPASFELWNGTGAILLPEVGGQLMPSVLEPNAVYRVPVAPGRTYVFTPVPAGVAGGAAYFAVGDENGICLDFATESIDSYEVPIHYNGVTPAYIYYGVADINNTGDIVFKDGRITVFQRTAEEAKEIASAAEEKASEAKTASTQAANTAAEALTEANAAKAASAIAVNTANEANRKVSEETERANNALSNALKGTASGSSVRLSDVSPVEHSLKVGLRSKNLLNVEEVYSDESVQKNEDGSFTQIAEDTRTSFRVRLCARKYGTYVKSLITSYDITNTGSVSYTFVKDDTFDELDFGHNGSTKNILCFIPISHLPNGTYTFSANLTNVTMGSLSWEDMQIEVGETATEYMPYLGDFSGVEVKAYGKNLFDASQLLKASGWTQANGVYSGKINDYLIAFEDGFEMPAFLPSTQYTISLQGYATNGATPRIYVAYTDGTEYALGIYASKITAYSYTTTAGKTVSKLYGSFGSGTNETLYLKDIQVELGDTATEYEAYKEEASYTPHADGTVEGVKSISHNMTLLTDRAGAILDAEYNRDLNKAYGALVKAIEALGGAI